MKPASNPQPVTACVTPDVRCESATPDPTRPDPTRYSRLEALTGFRRTEQQINYQLTHYGT